MQNPGEAPLLVSLGFFGFGGTAPPAKFRVPPGSNPAYAGLVFHHAYFVFDVFGSGQVALTSNAVPVTLVPQGWRRDNSPPTASQQPRAPARRSQPAEARMTTPASSRPSSGIVRQK